MVEQHRLGQLRFGDRRGHFQQRFAGEHHASLRYRPDLPGKPQGREGAQRILAVFLGAAKVVEVLRGEREILQELETILQVGSDEEATVSRKLPYEQAQGQSPGIP